MKKPYCGDFDCCDNCDPDSDWCSANEDGELESEEEEKASMELNSALNEQEKIRVLFIETAKNVSVCSMKWVNKKYWNGSGEGLSECPDPRLTGKKGRNEN